MLRQAFRLVARVSPGLARHAENLNVTINGWRFHDIKHYIDTRLAAGLDGGGVTLSRSFQAITAGAPGAGRIAFVSNMPPDDTGIAACSLYSWLGHDGPVDIFCPTIDADWFGALGALLAGGAGQGGPRLLDIGTLLTADQTVGYRAIVFAIGNSPHCYWVHKALKKLGAFSGLDRCVLYVHDPCLLNLVQNGSGISAQEMVQSMQTIYGRPLPEALAPGLVEWEVHEKLVEAGILGPRWFASLGVKRFVVNSAAAEALLQDDLAGTDTTISRVFHPVFLPRGAPEMMAEARATRVEDPDGTITIGSFGIPGTSKRTDAIIAAARLLQDRGQRLRLLLAGYGVRAYAATNARLWDGLDVTLFDGPSDLQLLQCMLDCDIGLQLRSRNLGESSGIVPQLLCLGRPTIVSDLGSFREFGDAVASVPPEATPEEIAAAIEQTLAAPPSAAAMARYVAERSPARFRQALQEALADRPVALRKAS
ncbi:glycosyltransferase [Paracraurococcus ruber]|uniref:Glycosyl transferase family 1 domain-containing protein n=1 Tax=Paracraurococcus ruber TaxID=77675 RepID=A0ABS1CWT1_9PROT|nr:glycosyltransferase [Paracraurococcus ruber]MBK1658701.1 hypothetical protein [Paracraurococcus ruber]TDG32218.1 glycosyltransferase family 1 protein [Paracraurococcus ruber]